MASKIKGIVVEIGGDTSALQKALSKLDNMTGSLNKELKNVNNALKFNPDNVDMLAQKEKLLTKEITKTGEKLELLQTHYDSLNDYIAEGNSLTAAQEEQYRALQREIANTSGKLNSLKAEASNWNKAGDSLIGFGDKVKNITEKVDKLGNTLVTKVTLPITALAGASINATANFEASMTKVAATMGITAKEIEQGSESYKILEEAARKSGETTKYSASQAADALNYLALAGYDAKKSAEVLPKVLNLAAAGDLELATASDMVTDAMAALNMETKDLDKYINQMAKTSQKSNTSVGQLGEATLTVAGAAKTANMSLETMNAELGILANNGIKGAEGGTHLRNIILSLTSPTDTAADAIKKLGIKVSDSKGNIRDLNDVMAEFSTKLSGMSDIEKTNVISTIFNKTDISAVNALIKGSGEEFANLKKEIEASDNAAQDMADTMNSSFEGQLTLLKSQIEGITITTGKKLMPTAKKAVKQVSSLADSFSELSDEQVTSIAKTGLFVASIGPAIKILNMFGKTTGAVITTTGNLFKAVSNVKNGVTTATGSVGKLTTALKLLTNPAGLAITAITALTTATYIYAKKSVAEIDSLTNVRDSIGEQAESWNKLKEAREISLQGTGNEIVTLEKLSSELKMIVDDNGNVKKGYEDRANFIVTNLNSALGTEMSLNDGIIQDYQTMQGEIDDLINKKKAEILLNAYADEYAEALRGQSTASAELKEATDAIAEAQKEMAGASELAKAQITHQIEQTADKIKEKKALIEEYQYTIGNYEALQKASISGTADELDLALSNMKISWQQYQMDTKLEISKTSSAVNEEVAKVASILGNDTTVPSSSKKLGEASNRLFIDELNKNIDGTKQDLANITTVIDEDTEVERASGDLGTDSAQTFKDNANSTSVGEDFTTGIAQGINNKSGDVYSTVYNLGQGMISELRASINSHSPSKETIDIGQDFDIGILLGVRNKKKDVLNEIEKLGTDSVSALNNNLNFENIEKLNNGLATQVINSSKNIFTTPNIVFNVQEMNEENLNRCFNYINRKFGSAYN